MDVFNQIKEVPFHFNLMSIFIMRFLILSNTFLSTNYLFRLSCVLYFIQLICSSILIFEC